MPDTGGDAYATFRTVFVHLARRTQRLKQKSQQPKYTRDACLLDFAEREIYRAWIRTMNNASKGRRY